MRTRWLVVEWKSHVCVVTTALYSYAHNFLGRGPSGRVTVPRVPSAGTQMAAEGPRDT